MPDASFQLTRNKQAVIGDTAGSRMLGGFRVAVALILLLPVPFAFAERGAIDPGKYILYTGGCISCHTSASGPDLAGGVPIETPFGLLFTTNITPDIETGIGGWSIDEFSHAMRKGTLPDGSHLYPAFPYTSYTLMLIKALNRCMTI